MEQFGAFYTKHWIAEMLQVL